MKNIILSAENACDIPLEELDKKGIKHISLKLYNETKGEDANDMSLMQFYDAVKKGDIFKTSLINEYEFEEYFKELVKDGDVLHIGFDGAISGTNKCVKDAAEKVNALGGNKVYVVDTLTGSGAQAIILKEVYNKMKEGKTFEELIEFAEDLKTRVVLHFSPEDLKTLARSGRCSKIVALIGNVLNIKPIIYVNDEGKFVQKQKVFARKRALTRMVELFKENYNFESKYVYILHGDSYSEADYMRDLILKDEKFKDVKFIIDYLGVIVGAHGGAGNMCICYTANKR